MSSGSLVYSNRKVCARGDGQNRRFRSFSNVDPTTRIACKRVLIHRFWEDESATDQCGTWRRTDCSTRHKHATLLI